MKCGLYPSLASVPRSLHFKRELKSDLRQIDTVCVRSGQQGLQRSWGVKLSHSIGSSTVMVD